MCSKCNNIVISQLPLRPQRKWLNTESCLIILRFSSLSCNVYIRLHNTDQRAWGFLSFSFWETEGTRSSLSHICWSKVSESLKWIKSIWMNVITVCLCSYCNILLHRTERIKNTNSKVEREIVSDCSLIMVCITVAYQRLRLKLNVNMHNRQLSLVASVLFSLPA